MDFSETKIGCIGCGAMGSALIAPMAKVVRAENVFVCAKKFENAKNFAQKHKFTALQSAAEVVEKANFIFLAVKPSVIPCVMKEIEPKAFGKTFISMAAGVTFRDFEKICADISGDPFGTNLSRAHFFRIMPNVCAAIKESMTTLALPEPYFGGEAQLETIKTLLAASGRVEIVEEKLLDNVMAVNGSGPAYAFVFIEALADAAVYCGMTREQAYIYAAQTLKGSAELVLKSKKNPSALKDSVCSPGGMTIRGIAALEKNNFRSAVFEAVKAAMA